MICKSEAVLLVCIKDIFGPLQFVDIREELVVFVAARRVGGIGIGLWF
jgi:hypothetical protein